MPARRKRNYKRERELARRRGEAGSGKPGPKPGGKKSTSGEATRQRALANVRKSGKKVGPNQEVDHKKPLKSGGGNSRKNLRVVSKSANRSRGGKSGNRKAKGTRKA